ncbi:unnamed protein product, partial [Meganyctiphanes norvegica]
MVLDYWWLNLQSLAVVAICHRITGTHGRGDTVIFPDELQTWSMSMKTGLAPEDKKMSMTSKKANRRPTQQDTNENTIMEMIKVIKDIEGESANEIPLINELMGIMKNESRKPIAVNRNQGFLASNQFSGPDFDKQLKEILSANGIETDLPFDCGRHPKSPSGPLASKAEPYPWIAALGSREDGHFHYRCIGLIITNNHILTDADCAKSPNIGTPPFVRGALHTAPASSNLQLTEPYIGSLQAYLKFGDRTNTTIPNNALALLEIMLNTLCDYVPATGWRARYAPPTANKICKGPCIILVGNFDESSSRSHRLYRKLSMWCFRLLGAAAC